MFRYVAEGARDEITLREAVGRLGSRSGSRRGSCATSRHVDTSATLLGTTFDAARGHRPDDAAARGRPRGEVAMARAAARRRVPLVRLQQRRAAPSRTIAGDRRHLVAAGLRRPRTARRLAAHCSRRPWRHGAAAVVLTADTPVLGTRYRPGPGPHVWETADPAWLGANAAVRLGLDPEEPLQGHGPRAGRRRLAGRATTGLPVVRQGRAARRRRRRLRRGRGCERGLGLQPRWPAARPDRGHGHAASPPSGRRRRPARRCTSTGECARACTCCWPLALGADAAFVGRPMFHALAAGGTAGVGPCAGRAGRRAGRVDAPRRVPDDWPHTRGIACPDWRIRLLSEVREPPLTCVNSPCDRGHSEPI